MTTIVRGGQLISPVVLTVGATTPTNAAVGSSFSVSLTQNTTLSNPTNLVNGGQYKWIIYQNAATAYTVALGGIFSPLEDTFSVDPTLSSVTILEAFYDGTNLYYSFSNQASISLQNHIFVAENGVNAPGGGALTSPFADPFYATTQVTGTVSNPQVIDISSGGYASGSPLLLKPNVSYLGTVQSIINPSTYGLDSSWSSAANGSYTIFTDLDVVGTFNINFSAITNITGLQYYNCTMANSQIILGNSSSATFISAEGTYFSSTIGIDSSNVYMDATNIVGQLTVSSTTSTSSFYAYSCSFMGGIVLDGANANSVTIRNSVVTGTITIEGTTTSLTIDQSSWPSGGFIFTSGASLAANVTIISSSFFPNGTVNASSATQAITTGNLYLCTYSSGPVTFTTIPAGATGQYFGIVGANSGWILNVGSGQSITIGNITAQTSGSDAWQTDLGNETVIFYCTSANNWKAISFTGLPYCNNGTPLPTNLITTNSVASSSVTAVGNNAYWINNGASLVTLTLDSSFNFFASGTEIHVFGNSSGGWKIVYGSGFKIIFGANSSTTTTGYLQSQTQYDWVKLKYIGSSTWQVFSYGGNPKLDTGVTLGVALLGSNNSFTAQNTIVPVALSSTGTVAWNLNTAPSATITASGNITLSAPTNAITGTIYTLMFVQAASGGPYTLTWTSSAYKFPGGVQPIVSTGASAVDIFTFYYDGSVMRAIGVSQNIS
jgi:hypothetical protein